MTGDGSFGDEQTGDQRSPKARDATESWMGAATPPACGREREGCGFLQATALRKHKTHVRLCVCPSSNSQSPSPSPSRLLNQHRFKTNRMPRLSNPTRKICAPDTGTEQLGAWPPRTVTVSWYDSCQKGRTRSRRRCIFGQSPECDAALHPSTALG